MVELASWGIQTGRGRRGAHLHHDAVNGRLRARPGARLAALTSGGAIPETGDYRVVLDPDGITVGAVHEDFAVESTAGDIFLLGTHSWRVTKVETGTSGSSTPATPRPPFPSGWARRRRGPPSCSAEVGDLRAAVEACSWPPATSVGARAEERARCPAWATRPPSRSLPTWPPAAALGTLPTCERLVIERCLRRRDGTQLVVHSPFGGRINRALGSACESGSASPSTSSCKPPPTTTPSRSRSDLTTVSRSPRCPPCSDPNPRRRPDPGRPRRTRCSRRGGGGTSAGRSSCLAPAAAERRPIHLQRMEAEDLLAAAWPSLAACQENAAPGPVPIPDHVLVRQTIDDCSDRTPGRRGKVVVNELTTVASALHQRPVHPGRGDQRQCARPQDRRRQCAQSGRSGHRRLGRHAPRSAQQHPDHHPGQPRHPGIADHRLRHRRR